MNGLEILGIALAIVLLIVGAIKSINFCLLTLVAAFMVALFGGKNPFDELIQTFAYGIGDFIIKYFLLFLNGALFGAVLNHCHVTKNMAIFLVEKAHLRNVAFVCGVITFLMAISGIKTYAILFIMVPIASALFMKAEINRALIPAALLGTFVSAQVFPGNLQLQNIIISQEYHIKETFATIPSLMLSLFLFAGVQWYINKAANIRTKRIVSSETLSVPVWKVLMAFACFILIFFLMNYLSCPAEWSLLIGAIYMGFLFRVKKTDIIPLFQNAFHETQKILILACINGFGKIIQNTAVVLSLHQLSDNFTGIHLLLLVAGIPALLSAAVGSSSASISISSEILYPLVMKNTDANELLGRILCIGSLTFDTLPYNSVVAMIINQCSVSYRDAYPHIFFTTVLFPIIGTILLCLWAWISGVV